MDKHDRELTTNHAWELYCQLVKLCPSINELRDELRDRAIAESNTNRFFNEAHASSEMCGMLDMLEACVSHGAICLGVRFSFPGANYQTGSVNEDGEYRKRPRTQLERDFQKVIDITNPKTDKGRGQEMQHDLQKAIDTIGLFSAGFPTTNPKTDKGENENE